MTRRLPTVLLAGALVVAAVSRGISEAVVNKLSVDAGRGAFRNVGGFVRAIFTDPAHQDSAFMLFTALVALMFLAGIVTVGMGALQAVRGDRGGIDTIVTGAYGLVAVLVMFAVIL